MRTDASPRAAWFPLLLSLPILVVALGFFLYPIIRMVLDTLVTHAPGTGWSVNVDAFTRVFADEFARGIVYRTLRVAFFATLLSLVIAYPLTLWMRQLSARWRGVLAVVLLSPLLMSVVVRTLGWVVILGPQGLLNDLLRTLGLGSFRILYSDTAIVFGLAHVFLGFMVLALLTSVLKIPDDVVAAAVNLGANTWQVLRHVVWPMALPGVIAGISIVFPLSAGAYVIPALLGGSRNPTLGTQIYQQAIVQLQFDRGAALSVVLFVMVFAVVAVFGLAARSAKGAGSR